ncbi:MAG: hypothetical protein ACE5O2_10635 [Armatimonadota bacterium]
MRTAYDRLPNAQGPMAAGGSPVRRKAPTSDAHARQPSTLVRPGIYRIKWRDVAMRPGERRARSALLRALRDCREREAKALRRLLWGEGE